MARDAAVAADPTVDFGPYDNDGNGFVDAFIVIHAGRRRRGDRQPRGHLVPQVGAASTLQHGRDQIFAYLTIPEDAKIGVCAHELGHLLFGFPDLYDIDDTLRRASATGA